MPQLLEVSEVIGPDRTVEWAQWYEVHRDEIPPPELLAAHSEVLHQPDRKMQYAWLLDDLHSNAPPAIEAVTTWMLRHEVMISKRYGIDDEEDSAAYVAHGMHFDPDEYFRLGGINIVELVTLGGYAVLLAKRTEQAKPLAVALRPNTRVTLLENVLHAVSRPLSLEALEHFFATRVLDETMGARESRTFLFGARNKYIADAQLANL